MFNVFVFQSTQHKSTALLWCCYLLFSVSNNDHTHFSIFNKENIERDEDAKVEDVNAVLDSHL